MMRDEETDPQLEEEWEKECIEEREFLRYGTDSEEMTEVSFIRQEYPWRRTK